MAVFHLVHFRVEIADGGISLGTRKFWRGEEMSFGRHIGPKVISFSKIGAGESWFWRWDFREIGQG